MSPALPQIDFYILPDDQQVPPLHYSCRLIEKIYGLGHHVYVYCQNPAQQEALEQQLWNLSQASFVPNARVDADNALTERTPVLTGHTPPPPALGGVLVNLTGQRPGFLHQFDRIAEIVPGRQEERTQSRENYRYYQQKGYPLQSHDIGNMRR